MNLLIFQDPDTRFTRCQDFQHSMTVSPVDPQALAKQEEQESKAHWRTKTGWIYPGKRSMIESNVHPSKPHISRIEELREVSGFLIFSWEVTNVTG